MNEITLPEDRQRKTPDSKILEGLGALAQCDGSTRRAHRACGIPESTLRVWKNKFPDQYLELRKREIPKIRDRVTEKLSEVFTKAHAVELKTLEKIEEALDAGDITPREYANLVRSISTTKGIALTHTDKFQGAAPDPDKANAVEAADALYKKLSRLGLLAKPVQAETEPVDAEVVEEGE